MRFSIRMMFAGKDIIFLVFSVLVVYEIVLFLRGRNNDQLLPLHRRIPLELENFHKMNMTQSTNYHIRQIELFLKQTSRAQRFERNQNLRTMMDSVITRLSRLNVGYSPNHEALGNVTIILNAVNEITNLSAVLVDLKRNPIWKTVKILLGMKRSDYDLFTLSLKDLKAKLPFFTWVIFKPNRMGTIAKTLEKLAQKTNTKYIFLARKLQKFDSDFDLIDFNTMLFPLFSRSVDVISGSVVYPDDRWSTGCYQTKLIWSQYKAKFGGDVGFDQGFIQCDYMDGPLVVDRAYLINFLRHSIKTNCLDKLLYPELMYMLKNENKVIKINLSSTFHLEDANDFRDLVRMEWLIFSFRNQVSEIITTSENDKRTHFEFSYLEAKSDCNANNKGNMLKPRSCMRFLHQMLMDSYKLFDRLGYGYTNEDGSGMAATKLDDTLPWDLDQDFAFRSSNFTDLLKHEKEFMLHGIHFKADIDKPCLQNVSASNGLGDEYPQWACGYIAVRGGTWRLEAWGEHVLIGDLYQPWNLHPFFKNVFPPNRIIGHDTKVRMRDHWSQNRPNPGLYARSHYGYDVLRHAKHWMQGGSNRGDTSWGDYITKPRFENCPVEEHHLCLNQYLADGNIQFQRSWA